MIKLLIIGEEIQVDRVGGCVICNFVILGIVYLMLGPFPCGGKLEKLDLGNLLSKGKFYMSSIFPVGKFKYPVIY